MLRSLRLVKRTALHAKANIDFPESVRIAKMSSGSKILANGVNLYYEKVGSGNHALLLMPGALGSIKTDFDPQMKLLNRDKFTVVGFDPRGYGKSRPPNRDFPMDFLYRDADDGAALMKALGIGSYSVVGWSDGCNAACILAAKHSENVQKLVVWGGNSYFTQEELIMYQNVRDLTSWSDRMKQPMIDVYGEEYFEKTWHAWVDVFVAMQEKYADEHGNTDLFQDLLADIKAQTLIVHGMKDALVPLFQAKNLHKSIKNSRLEVWNDGKHNLHLRYAEKFNKLLEDFLTSASRL